MRRPRVLDEREYLEENVLYLEDLKADIEAELAEIKALLKREKERMTKKDRLSRSFSLFH